MFEKILIAFLASISAALIFTGCTSREKDNKTEEPPMKEEMPAEPPKEELPPDNNPPSEEEKNKNNKDNQAEEEKQPEDSAVMSRDWAQIGALNGEKLCWGPGGPVDKDNRSEGAIAYQNKYGKYDADFIAPADQKNIYLTFDEGYENGYTAKILDVLKDKKVSAVFFVTGHYVESNPDLIRRMIDEGHIVGNHTWKHPSVPDISLEDAETDILKLHNYVKENFDYTMNLFRFPSGEFNEQSLLLLQQLGYRSSFWSFAYKDWIADAQPNNEEALKNLEAKVHPGAIYLLHAVSSTNTEILPQFIDDMRADGYKFCNYNEMYATPAKEEAPAKEQTKEEKDKDKGKGKSKKTSAEPTLVIEEAKEAPKEEDKQN